MNLIMIIIIIMVIKWKWWLLLCFCLLFKDWELPISIISTRSTSRAQTSTAPSLMRENSLIRRENFTKIHSAFVLLLRYTHPENRKKSYFQGVERNIPEMFQIVPCVICDISCKFHENPFIRFSVVLLKDMTPRLAWRPWNSLANSFVVLCPTYPENLMKIHFR